MFLREMLGEEYVEWQEGQVIIISAPTGAGKSTFFETVYKDYMMLQGKRILYLTNRILLKNQMLCRQEQRIQEQMAEESAFWRMFQKNEAGYFVIATYQQVESALLFHNMQQINYFSSFDVVIADECHYFICDANFNPNTIVSFEFLISQFRNRRLIFMSATLGNFYAIIIEYINRATRATDLFVNGMFPAFRYYNLDADYTDIQFDYIYETKEIVGKIADLPIDDKIVIFVSTIKEGAEIKKLLCRQVTGEDICLLNSRTVHTEKGAEVAEELVEKQQFSGRILIATALVDTGINIIDQNVKAVFLLQNNEESAVQMLGRIRRLAGVRLYVCLHARTDEYFRKKYERLMFELRYVDRICGYERNNAAFFDIIVGKEFYDTEKVEVLKKFVGMNFWPNANRRYFINTLSCYRMQQMCQEYRAIFDDFNNLDANAFLYRQCSCWFGIQPDTLRLAKPTTHLEAIANMLGNYVNNKMPKDEFDELRAILMPLLHKADRKMFPKITELAKWQKINDFLTKNEIPFVIFMYPKNKNSERSYEIKVVESGLIYER